MPSSSADSSQPASFLKTIQTSSSESDVEHKVVIPLLNLLGYDHTDWRSQVSIHSLKVDFLVYPKELKKVGLPYLVIEVKSPKKNISQCHWQLQNYMRQSKAVLGLLTNGYRFILFYNFQGDVGAIAEYSQTDLANPSCLFYKLLRKSTAIKLANTIAKSQTRITWKFLSVISEAFSNSEMLQFLSQQNTSGNYAVPTQAQTTQQEKNKSMIITVFNNKGGVGKTTMTVNLAATLARMGKKILLIDIDAQANLSTGLGIDPLNDIEEAGKKDVTHLLIEAKTTLKEVVYRKRWKDIQLDVVPSHIRLSRMESRLNQIVDSDRILAKKLKNHDYDFVFIDPPPSFGKVNGISLMASSGILIPMELAPYPIRALEYVIAQAQEVEDYKGEPLPIIGIAVSMYDQRSTKFNLSMTELLQDILSKNSGDQNIPLFPENTWIPQLNIVSQCPGKGYPIHCAEFDNSLSTQDREAAQKALHKYENLASFLTSSI